METFQGISIAHILSHNQNWWNFYCKYKHLIRDSIVKNICKVLACASGALGFATFTCENCGHSKIVHHTCKSRFCSSCGKKATEQWLKNICSDLPDVPFQHITFTLPQELRELFRWNRQLMNQLVCLPAKIITALGKQKGLIPGIFTVIHTFGRDLKENVHFHVAITAGGPSLDFTKWIPDFFIYHQTLKNMWTFEVIKALRSLYKQGKLALPAHLNIHKYQQLNAWLDFLYQKSWVVFLDKKTKNFKQTIKYLGRYLKRPPLAKTRIKKYDGQHVTFTYHDHYTGQTLPLTLTVEDFIKRLIVHIPDNNFRMVRYYNWLSNRTRSELLPNVFKLLGQTASIPEKIHWRKLFIKSFGKDPLECPICKTIMKFVTEVFTSISTIISQQQELITIPAQ